MNGMETLLWLLVPGFLAIGSGLLVWFIMQSRMEVQLAQERESLAEERGAIHAHRSTLESALDPILWAAEEKARRVAIEGFLDDLRVEQRHYTRESRRLSPNRRSLVLQERMYFRNIPLSDWIEHEIALEEGSDIQRLVQEMTVFDKPVVSIPDIERRRKALA
jgi:hypothetical protein